MNSLLHKAILAFSLVILTGPVLSQENETSMKGEEKEFQEVVITDSVPAANLTKRAISWVKTDSRRFVKSNGVTTGTKAECVAKFKIRAKELNPQPDYTGIIEMHVSIECKDNKYRYTINKIKHISANGKASGGDINNTVPDCGSMTMPDGVWKKIKGEAFKSAGMVISELKEGMTIAPKEGSQEW